MKLKKIVALSLAALLAIPAFGAMTVNADEPIELTFWGLSSRQDAIEGIAEAFNEANPDVHVTVSLYDTDGIKDACKVAASSDTLPSMWFNWGGSLGGFYADNGKVMDMTEYAKENGWEDKFNAGALALLTRNGQLTGYPSSYNVLGVYYNKAIFDELGIEIPTTFEEFEAACDALKEAGITPIQANGLYGWHLMRWIELLVEHYAGPELHDNMNTFAESWNNDAVVQALSKYREWVEKGYFLDGFITLDPNDTLLTFGMGDTAMDLQGQWYDGQFIQNGLSPEDFGVFAFPSDQGDRMSAFAEQTQFNANLTPEELDAAVRFMDFYHSPEMIELYSEYFNLPLPIEGSEAPAEQVNVEPMIAMSAENGTFTITDQAFPTEVADVLFNAQEEIANGSMTPEQGAENIQNAIDAYLAK